MSNISLAMAKPEIDAILKRYGVVDVSVFGSFARNEATATSDLDLLVTYKPGTNLFDVMSLQDELEVALGRKVDLVSQKYISHRLAKRITNDIRPLSAVL